MIYEGRLVGGRRKRKGKIRWGGGIARVKIRCKQNGRGEFLSGEETYITIIKFWHKESK